MITGEEDRQAVEREGVERRGPPACAASFGGVLVRPGSDHLQRVGVRNLSDAGAKLVLGGLGVVYPDTVLMAPRCPVPT